MIWILLLVGLLIPVLLSLVFFIAPGKVSPEAKAMAKVFYGLNCAHRGLYTKDQKIPENSIPAFAAAQKENYGVELDIQFSRDKQVIVFHDDDLKRMCNIDARVDSMDWDELSALPLSGTGECIPLLTDVIDLLSDTPVIVELKAAGNNNIMLCEETLKIMRQKGINWCVESFDPFIVAWFRKHAPDVLRGQLSCLPREYNGLSKISSFVLGNLLMNFISRPHFIAYSTSQQPLLVRLCRILNPINVIWTAKPDDDITRFEKENDTIIFEHYKPATRYKSF